MLPAGLSTVSSVSRKNVWMPNDAAEAGSGSTPPNHNVCQIPSGSRSWSCVSTKVGSRGDCHGLMAASQRWSGLRHCQAQLHQ